LAVLLRVGIEINMPLNYSKQRFKSRVFLETKQSINNPVYSHFEKPTFASAKSNQPST
jgi:hypothetical protein